MHMLWLRLGYLHRAVLIQAVYKPDVAVLDLNMDYQDQAAHSLPEISNMIR